MSPEEKKRHVEETIKELELQVHEVVQKHSESLKRILAKLREQRLQELKEALQHDRKR